MCIKMNKISNKVLLMGDKCMPEMHLKQPGFTYSACGPFTKNTKRVLLQHYVIMVPKQELNLVEVV